MKDAIPSGSKAPGEGDKEVPSGKNQEQDNNTGNAGEDGKILGKFKTPEDLAKAYADLEAKMSKQSNEIGKLRKLTEQSQKPPQDEKKNTEPPKNYDEAKAQIEEKVESGELSVTEGMTMIGELVREQTADELEQKFDEYDRKRSADEMYSKFINDNPDFLQMDESGALDDVIAQNPMHDKFSAYLLLKGQQEAQSAFEKGKEEALKLAKGAEGTRSILQNPGTAAREAPKPKKGMSESEKINGMLAALSSVRNG